MSAGPITAAPPMAWPKLRWTVQVWPFQRSARDWAPPVVNAQTPAADVAAAAMTVSLRSPGNGASVHDDPLRRQAVGFGLAAAALVPNAHPPFRPVATTAVKSPPGTCFTIFQASAGPDPADPAVPAASAGEAAVPAARAAAATTTAAPAATRFLISFLIASNPFDCQASVTPRVMNDTSGKTRQSRIRAPHAGHSFVTVTWLTGRARAKADEFPPRCISGRPWPSFR